MYIFLIACQQTTRKLLWWISIRSWTVL